MLDARGMGLRELLPTGEEEEPRVRVRVRVRARATVRVRVRVWDRARVRVRARVRIRAKERNRMSTPTMTNSRTASEVRSVSVLPRLSAVIRLSLSPMSCPSRLLSTEVSERSARRRKR